MKSIVFFLVLLVTTFSAKAQDVKKILSSGKWYVTLTQESGQQPEEADDKKDEWVIFLPSGKTEEEHFGEKESAKWMYISKNKEIKISGIEERIQKIIEITNQKLVVEVLESGVASTILTYTK